MSRYFASGCFVHQQGNCNLCGQAFVHSTQDAATAQRLARWWAAAPDLLTVVRLMLELAPACPRWRGPETCACHRCEAQRALDKAEPPAPAEERKHVEPSTPVNYRADTAEVPAQTPFVPDAEDDGLPPDPEGEP